MSISYIFILAFIQGLTEFLPVSSSAHLLILPYFMKVEDQGVLYDVVAHTGSLLAVIIFYWSDIVELLKDLFLKGRDKSLILKLVVASIPVAVLGMVFLLLNLNLRSPFIVVVTSIIFGVFLYWADLKGDNQKEIKTISIKDSFIIGLYQMLATIPGVSRSGATVTGARMLGMKREEGLKFSFLLSIPTILMVSCGGVLKVLKNGAGNIILFDAFILFCLSFLFSLLSIKIMMKFIRSHSFKIFALYRVMLGIFIYFFLKF